MLEFLNKVIDANKPWLFIGDTIENIVFDLENYTLDPTFEQYGNFVNRQPHWLKREVAEKYKGCTSIFGNFYNKSHAFRLITDDEEVIIKIQQLVNKNKNTKKYKQAKTEVLKRKQERKESIHLSHE